MLGVCKEKTGAHTGMCNGRQRQAKDRSGCQNVRKALRPPLGQFPVVDSGPIGYIEQDSGFGIQGVKAEYSSQNSEYRMKSKTQDKNFMVLVFF